MSPVNNTEAILFAEISVTTIANTTRRALVCINRPAAVQIPWGVTTSDTAGDGEVPLP